MGHPTTNLPDGVLSGKSRENMANRSIALCGLHSCLIGHAGCGEERVKIYSVITEIRVSAQKTHHVLYTCFSAA